MRKICHSLKWAFEDVIVLYVLFFAICMAFMQNSWAKTVTPTSSSANIATNDQKPIVLQKPNQKFNIILKSNPTTGYIWVLNQYDASSITPVKRIYHAPKLTNAKGETVVGAPGYEKWQFMLNKSAMSVPRLTKITFCMMRPWTINCDIQKTFTVVYTV